MQKLAQTLMIWFASWLCAGAAAAAPVTLAIADLPVFAVALIAEDQGYFAAEGLDLKTIHCVNGKRCLKHLTDGEVQYATVADTPLVLAALAGTPFEILATIAGAARNNYFLARTDRGIGSAADLKGKRIGILQGTTAHYFVESLLLFNGIAPGKATLVPLDPVDPTTALLRGDVDAAGLYDPFGPRAFAAASGRLIKIPNPSVFTITVNLVRAGKASGAKDDDSVKLLRALRRANALIESDPAKARSIVATRLRLVPAQLESMWGDFDFAVTLAQPLIATLEAQSRWALRESLVPGGKMPDYLDYVNLAPLRSIDAKSVSIVK